MNVKCRMLQRDVGNQFISFMMKTVNGLKLDFLRREKKRKSEILSGNPEVLFKNMNQEYNLEIGEIENEKLMNAFDALSKKQRIVLHLVIFEDNTEKTAAEILKITQQGVHQTKKRALLELERALKEGRK